jgi:hypothetical protein
VRAGIFERRVKQRLRVERRHVRHHVLGRNAERHQIVRHIDHALRVNRGRFPDAERGDADDERDIP